MTNGGEAQRETKSRLGLDLVMKQQLKKGKEERAVTWSWLFQALDPGVHPFPFPVAGINSTTVSAAGPLVGAWFRTGTEHKPSAVSSLYSVVAAGIFMPPLFWGQVCCVERHTSLAGTAPCILSLLRLLAAIHHSPK